MCDPNDISPGDLVLYTKSPTHYELGCVKSIREHGAFVAYHLGDTVAMTPFDYIQPIVNDYAAKGLVQRSEQLGHSYDDITEGCEAWQPV